MISHIPAGSHSQPGSIRRTGYLTSRHRHIDIGDQWYGPIRGFPLFGSSVLKTLCLSHLISTRSPQPLNDHLHRTTWRSDAVSYAFFPFQKPPGITAVLLCQRGNMVSGIRCPRNQKAGSRKTAAGLLDAGCPLLGHGQLLLGVIS